MIPIIPSAALTVRFLTRRFIGEYGDMGECQARARPVPNRDWGQETALLLLVGFHFSPSSPVSPEPLPSPRGSMLYLFSDPSLCSRTASLGCKRSRVAAGDTMKMTIFFFSLRGQNSSTATT